MKSLLRVVACFSFCVSLNTFGALYDRGNGLIYDDVLDITWLQDANYAQTSGYDSDGRMHWSQAKAWAAELSYGGYDNWRLPSANLMNPNNPCYAYDGSCDQGYNNTTGELGHMFYNNLGNLGYWGADINFQPDYGLINSSFTDATAGGGNISFLNTHSYYYWLDDDYVPTDAWAFGANYGIQGTTGKGSVNGSWAVHDGDIGASPVPLPAGIYLFLSGLVGLGLMRGRNA